jgi:hypothetical protein
VPWPDGGGAEHTEKILNTKFTKSTKT